MGEADPLQLQPPYLRLPSFPELNPYLIAYLFGFPSGETRNVLVDMQVFSAGGSVRLQPDHDRQGVCQRVRTADWPDRIRLALGRRLLNR